MRGSANIVTASRQNTPAVVDVWLDADNRHVDMISEGYDMVIRVTDQPEDGMVARKVDPTLITYGESSIKVVLRIVLVLAILSIFGATLTMPGIAALLLTVGMAVDANVLIFERIREELRRGHGPAAAQSHLAACS